MNVKRYFVYDITAAIVPYTSSEVCGGQVLRYDCGHSSAHVQTAAGVVVHPSCAPFPVWR